MISRTSWLRHIATFNVSKNNNKSSFGVRESFLNRDSFEELKAAKLIKRTEFRQRVLKKNRRKMRLIGSRYLSDSQMALPFRFWNPFVLVQSVVRKLTRKPTEYSKFLRHKQREMIVNINNINTDLPSRSLDLNGNADGTITLASFWQREIYIYIYIYIYINNTKFPAFEKGKIYAILLRVWPSIWLSSLLKYWTITEL